MQLLPPRVDADGGGGARVRVRARGVVRAFGLLAVFGVVQPAVVGAEEWLILGARQHGIGGAGVAAATGAQAARWNPGALGFESDLFEIEVPLGLTVSAEGDLLENGARLIDFFDGENFDDVLDKIDARRPLNELELQKTLVFATNVLPGFAERGQGAFGFGDTGFSIRRGSWVLSARSQVIVAAGPRLDLNGLAFTDVSISLPSVVLVPAMPRELANPGSAALATALVQAVPGLSQAQAEELAFQAEQAGIDTNSPGVRSVLASVAGGVSSGADNQTSARVRGLYTKEIALAFGTPLVDERISLGFNVRYIHGTTVSKTVFADGDEPRSITTSDKRRSRQLAVDAGLLFEPNEWVRLGVAIRNANRPEFKTRQGTPIALDPQIRAGLAIWLDEGWLVAADLDLVENDYEGIRDLESQTFSLGTEYRAGIFGRSVDLRLGVRRNLAESLRDAPIVTAGLGLYLGSFRLDLAFAASLEDEEVEELGFDVPERVDVAVTLRYLTEF